MTPTELLAAHELFERVRQINRMTLPTKNVEKVISINTDLGTVTVPINLFKIFLEDVKASYCADLEQLGVDLGETR